MAIHHVFVYGTLLRDMDNFHLIRPFIGLIVPGEVAGKLYHLSYGYPALLLDCSAAAVQGEVVEIIDMAKALPVLDRLEGYHGPGHPDNLYHREERLIRTAGGEEVLAYVYSWARPELLAGIGTPVADGNWRLFMARRRDDVCDRYYFAYGSFMDDAVIAACAYPKDFKKLGVARLGGWRFCVNKRAGAWGRANIEPAEGHCVYGVLFHITGRAEKQVLNRRDGYPDHYFKEYLDVVCGGVVYPSAVVHVAMPEHIAEGLPMADDYAASLRQGAGVLPEEYRDELLTAVERCSFRQAHREGGRNISGFAGNK